MNNSIDKFKEIPSIFFKYQKIINVLIDNKDKDGISRISQKEISYQVGISQTLVSICLKRLEKYDRCVEKLAPGKYAVYKTDMIKYGPLNKVNKFIEAINLDNSILQMKHNEQSKLLNMSIDEIKMIHGYINSPIT